MNKICQLKRTTNGHFYYTFKLQIVLVILSQGALCGKQKKRYVSLVIKLNLNQLKGIKEYCLISRIFYSNQQQLQYPITPMKITSPFIEHIPECKRSMRRLRKKIYKFITSKHHTHTKTTPKKDILLTLKQCNVPSFLVDCLSRKKTVDLNSINNMILSMKVPLSDIIEMTSKQEQEVCVSQLQWAQNSKAKLRVKSHSFLDDLRLKQQQSRKTISSTEFQYQEQDYEYGLDSSVPDNNQRQFSQPELDESADQYMKFNHFVTNSGFLDMEQSILSHENLFRFQ